MGEDEVGELVALPGRERAGPGAGSRGRTRSTGGRRIPSREEKGTVLVVEGRHLAAPGEVERGKGFPAGTEKYPDEEPEVDAVLVAGAQPGRVVEQGCRDAVDSTRHSRDAGQVWLGQVGDNLDKKLVGDAVEWGELRGNWGRGEVG